MFGNIESYVGDTITLKIYTAQVKYTNLDKIKNNPEYLILEQNKIYCPIRGIVLGRKNSRLTDKQFKQMYYDFLKESFELNEKQWDELLDRNTIIIASNSYYHKYADRVLLANFLELFNATYMGEIEI